MNQTVQIQFADKMVSFDTFLSAIRNVVQEEIGKRPFNGNVYGETLPDTVKKVTGSTSQLNPLFVEEMMGFPLMWTALPFLSPSGDKNP